MFLLHLLYLPALPVLSPQHHWLVANSASSISNSACLQIQKYCLCIETLSINPLASVRNLHTLSELSNLFACSNFHFMFASLLLLCYSILLDFITHFIGLPVAAFIATKCGSWVLWLVAIGREGVWQRFRLYCICCFKSICLSMEVLSSSSSSSED